MSAQQEVRACAEDLFRGIGRLIHQPTTLMEVCGTHTMVASRSGLRDRLPGELRLLSGPGCPVCVTPAETIDQLLAMAAEPGVTIATFGDMIHVPGSRSSLSRMRSRGRDIQVVYSPLEALELARRRPSRLVVFMGVGFETTAPTVAATILRAAGEGLSNFLVLAAFKQIPPAMCALAGSDETRIHGFLCPGNVSAIIGAAPYEPLALEHGIPCAVTGFEPTDMLEGIFMLLRQMREGRSEVEIQYRRVVSHDGNTTAGELMGRVFQTCDARWRGIGLIPDSGLELAGAFCEHDARHRIPTEVPKAPDLPAGCSCGEVLRGRLIPPECPLFGRGCSPENPVGPCMVSSEGACAAYFNHGTWRDHV